MEILLLLFQGMPYLALKEDWESREGNDRYEGYVADIAADVAERVGFTYVIRPVRDGKWGSQEDDGSWNGMIGELINRVSSYQLCMYLPIHCLSAVNK